jgi:lipopolysaccharide export system permease protein
MLLIDRYLLREFIKAFLIFFCSLVGLYIVIDAFNNLEEFISFAKTHRGLTSTEGTGGNLFVILGEYYAPRALGFFDQTSGILTLIAAMFTVTWIQRHNELTALQAAGIAKRRVLMPVILAVASIALLSAADREIMIPRFRYQLSHNAQNLGGSSSRELTPRYDNRTEVLFRGQSLHADQQRIEKPSFLMPASLQQYGKGYLADNAFYRPQTEERPSGYLMVGLTLPRDLDDKPSLRLGDRVVVYTRRDLAELQPGECFVASDVNFEQLEDGASWRQYSSWLELVRGMRNPSLGFGPDVRVAIHARVVQPLLDITLLFLGLPLIVSGENRNVFRAIGLCLCVVLAFQVVVIACQWLGSSYYVNPALAAWLPLLIFVPTAVAMSDPLRA